MIDLLIWTYCSLRIIHAFVLPRIPRPATPLAERMRQKALRRDSHRCRFCDCRTHGNDAFPVNPGISRAWLTLCPECHAAAVLHDIAASSAQEYVTMLWMLKLCRSGSRSAAPSMTA